MTPESFCYWLQGFLEMTDQKTMTEKQMDMLKKHIALVFLNVTGDPPAAGACGSGGSEEPKKEILTDSAKEKLKKEILDRVGGTGRGSLWDRGTTWCSSSTGLSSRGAKIC